MNKVFLYNTLTRKKEEFVPINPPNVGIYSCGPTVYWNQHIGHMYAYVHWDILARYLRSIGYNVKWVMNITDVGHMTGENVGNPDTGEDKMEKGAKRENVSVWQIADKYIAQFLDSVDKLGIKRPDVLCRATEHINEQIELVKKMESRGFTYKTSTGIVFDTSKFPDYAGFAKLKLTHQDAGSRVEVDQEKKNPWDFLLWVTNQPEHIMKWDSPWGVGFPGWHLECTAMSTKYLGEKFDIHTGGKEHVAIHHTNEIAQGFGAFGARTANYWLHNEWLTLKGEKISKSLGNMITVSDVIEKGYDPLAVRYLILNSNYRKGMDFTWEALEAAQRSLDKLREQVLAAKNQTERTELSPEKEDKRKNLQDDFNEALSDDLNVTKGLSILWEALKSNIPSGDKYDLAISFDEVLGLGLKQVSGIKYQVSGKIQKLINERNKLRNEGKFDEADLIRKQIEEKGYTVVDTKESSKIITNKYK